VHVFAAAAETASYGAGAYLVVFALMALSFAGIPAIGGAVVGRLAVFFTSTMVSGMLRMKYSQFVVWNFIVGAVYVLSIGPAAYGAGKVSASEQDAGSLAALVAGLAIGAGCVTLAVRYYRRHKARRLLGNAATPR
jgi:hypothetical protein